MHFNKQKRQHYDIHVGGCQNADLRFWFMLSTHRRINKIFVWKLHRYKPYNLHNDFFLSQNDGCEAADPRLCWVHGRWVCFEGKKRSRQTLTKPPPLLSHQSYASKPVLQGRAQKAARLLILPLSPRPPGMQILKWYSVQCSAPQSGIEMICGSAVD